MDGLQKVIGDYEGFVKNLLGQVKAAGFDLTDFSQMDHLCYRVETENDYQQKKRELATVGREIRETLVSGRLIATFRLHQPIRVEGWRIDAVELPAPKEGRPFKEGLEHVEFVLYDDIPAFLKKYSGKTFNLQSADRGINPEIGYPLDGCTVKFHLLSLPAVVYIEEKLEITEVKN
jgi:predicted metalloenzyme YecM